MQKVVQQAIGTIVAVLLVAGCTGAPAAPPAQSSRRTAIPSAAATDLADDAATQPPAIPATPVGNAANLEATITAVVPIPETSSVAPSPFTGVQSIDVGGYQLSIECAGEGSPTVVLDHGMGGSKYDWWLVQPDVATFTRVCSYTRAGPGQGPYPRTSQQMATQLHTLLEKAGIAGPYVLVGHSFGGYNVRLYADQYPDEVVGLVLVDAAHEDQHARFLAALPPAAPDESQGLKELRAYLENPTPYQNPEGVDEVASTAQVRASGSLGDLPLVVLTAGNFDFAPPDFPADVVARQGQAWLEMQQDLARLSTNSTHIIVEESGHNIPKEQPQVVVDAIRQVIEAAREH
jgi:pimeloyl-ACP methyl ester carboxylesterase